MNQYPPGSQGVHGKLSTGRWGSLGVAAMDQKKIDWAYITYGVILVQPVGGIVKGKLEQGCRWAVVKG